MYFNIFFFLSFQHDLTPSKTWNLMFPHCGLTGKKSRKIPHCTGCPKWLKKASDSIKVLKLNVSPLWFDRKKNLEKSLIAKGAQNDWKKPMNDFHQRGRNGKSERKQEKPHWQEKWVGWLTKRWIYFPFGLG